MKCEQISEMEFQSKERARFRFEHDGNEYYIVGNFIYQDVDGEFLTDSYGGRHYVTVVKGYYHAMVEKDDCNKAETYKFINAIQGFEDVKMRWFDRLKTDDGNHISFRRSGDLSIASHMFSCSGHELDHIFIHTFYDDNKETLNELGFTELIAGTNGILRNDMKDVALSEQKELYYPILERQGNYQYQHYLAMKPQALFTKFWNNEKVKNAVLNQNKKLDAKLLDCETGIEAATELLKYRLKLKKEKRTITVTEWVES